MIVKSIIKIPPSSMFWLTRRNFYMSSSFHNLFLKTVTIIVKKYTAGRQESKKCDKQLTLIVRVMQSSFLVSSYYENFISFQIVVTVCFSFSNLGNYININIRSPFRSVPGNLFLFVFRCLMSFVLIICNPY